MSAIRLSRPHRTTRDERELASALTAVAGPMLPTGLTLADLGSARRVRKLAARYDAAQTTDDNRRHWANADALSANAANSASIRQILRNRARYEVANNSYAKGIVLTIANDLVGTGPRLQMLTADEAFNQAIEREWRAWARRVRLAQKLRTMRMARCVDGESFALPINNDNLVGPVKLDLRLVEADQFTSLGADAVLPNAVDGIVFDEFGNPQTYHMLRNHPGDGKLVSYKVEDVQASQVIHWFRCDRPGQLRGIPDLMPALPLFAQLRRYTLAVLTAAESAAEHAGVIYTESPPDDQTVDMQPLETLETEKGMFTFLPGGWKMGQMQAEQPATTYREFKQEIVSEIARCLNLPLIVALLQAKEYNMASGRLDLQTYFKSLDVERDDLGCVVLDPLFDNWIEEAARVARLSTDAGTDHVWLWTGREHVDPAKEAAATVARRRSWTSSLAAEYASIGDDWEPNVKQIVREARVVSAELGVSLKEALEILGLASATAGSGRPAGTPNDPAANGDDE